MAVYSQLPMYYVDLQMDDNVDKISVDLIIIPTTDHPQISIILDDTCDDCSLKTNLIVTNISDKTYVCLILLDGWSIMTILHPKY